MGCNCTGDRSAKLGLLPISPLPTAEGNSSTQTTSHFTTTTPSQRMRAPMVDSRAQPNPPRPSASRSSSSSTADALRRGSAEKIIPPDSRLPAGREATASRRSMETAHTPKESMVRPRSMNEDKNRLRQQMFLVDGKEDTHARGLHTWGGGSQHPSHRCTYALGGREMGSRQSIDRTTDMNTGHADQRQSRSDGARDASSGRKETSAPETPTPALSENTVAPVATSPKGSRGPENRRGDALHGVTLTEGVQGRPRHPKSPEVVSACGEVSRNAEASSQTVACTTASMGSNIPHQDPIFENESAERESPARRAQSSMQELAQQSSQNLSSAAKGNAAEPCGAVVPLGGHEGIQGTFASKGAGESLDELTDRERDHPLNLCVCLGLRSTSSSFLLTRAESASDAYRPFESYRWNLSSSDASGLSPGESPRTGPKSPHTLSKEDNPSSPRLTEQPPKLSMYNTPTCAAEHRVSDTQNTASDDTKEEEEVDVLTRAHPPLYDLDFVMSSVRETYREKGVLLSCGAYPRNEAESDYIDDVFSHNQEEGTTCQLVADKPSFEGACPQISSATPNLATARPQRTSPPLVERHKTPRVEETIFMLELASTKPGQMGHGGSLQRNPILDAAARRSLLLDSLHALPRTGRNTWSQPPRPHTQVPPLPLLGIRGDPDRAKLKRLDLAPRSTGATAPVADKPPPNNNEIPRASSLPTVVNDVNQGTSKIISAAYLHPISPEPKTKWIRRPSFETFFPPSPVEVKKCPEPQLCTAERDDSPEILPQHLCNTVRIYTPSQEVDGCLDPSEMPALLRNPTTGILVTHSSRTPGNMCVRGPRTRRLPGGQRRADWTPPTTHYTTTLTELAEALRDEDDTP